MPEEVRSYGEVVYFGKILPSCQQCAAVLKVRWRRIALTGTCAGCEVALVPMSR